MAAKPIDPDKLRSLADIARELGYHPSYLNRLAAQGHIKAWRIGKAWATTAELVQKYINAVPVGGRSARKRGGSKSK
jgi:excisionase family DNA binding protein